jgi:hypothetical protein
MTHTSKVPMHSFKQGERRILLGRDDNARTMLVVVRDADGYKLHSVRHDEPETLRELLLR